MSTIGKKITLTTFGESHGSYVGCVLDGIPSGLEIDFNFIEYEYEKRFPTDLESPRYENTDYQIISGVNPDGKTNGNPICIVIRNSDIEPDDDDNLVIRPGTGDYADVMKNLGFGDQRSNGHSSGRLSTPMVVAGAICKQILQILGVVVKAHILSCGDFNDYMFENDHILEDFKSIDEHDLPIIDDNEEEYEEVVKDAISKGDSIGGIVEVACVGVVPGTGGHWFDSVQGHLSTAVMSTPGIRGIEFGKGFEFADCYGSDVNDEMYIDEDDGNVKHYSNNNGGTSGGITTGEPIIYRAVCKPTPSINKPQKTIDFTTFENTTIQYNGRNDPTIVRKMCPTLEALTAIVILDEIILHQGTFTINNAIIESQMKTEEEEF